MLTIRAHNNNCSLQMSALILLLLLQIIILNANLSKSSGNGSHTNQTLNSIAKLSSSKSNPNGQIVDSVHGNYLAFKVGPKGEQSRASKSRNKSNIRRQPRLNELSSESSETASDEDQPRSNQADESNSAVSPSFTNGIDQANRMARNVNRRLEAIDGRVNQIESLIKSDNPQTNDRNNLTPSSHVPLTYDITAIPNEQVGLLDPESTAATDNEAISRSSIASRPTTDAITNHIDTPQLVASVTQNGAQGESTTIAANTDDQPEARYYRDKMVSGYQRDDANSSTIRSDIPIGISRTGSGSAASSFQPSEESGEEGLRSFKNNLPRNHQRPKQDRKVKNLNGHRHRSDSSAYPSGTLEMSQSQPTNTITMPDYYFSESNNVNHNVGHQSAAVPISENRFQNMTIINSENDLAKSNSNLNPSPTRPPNQYLSLGSGQSIQSAFNYSDNWKDKSQGFRKEPPTTTPNFEQYDATVAPRVANRWNHNHAYESSSHSGLAPRQLNQLYSDDPSQSNENPSSSSDLALTSSSASQSIQKSPRLTVTSPVSNHQENAHKRMDQSGKSIDRMSSGDSYYGNNLNHRSAIQMGSNYTDSSVTSLGASGVDQTLFEQPVVSSQLDELSTRVNGDQSGDQTTNYSQQVSFPPQYQTSQSGATSEVSSSDQQMLRPQLSIDSSTGSINLQPDQMDTQRGSYSIQSSYSNPLVNRRESQYQNAQPTGSLDPTSTSTLDESTISLNSQLRPTTQFYTINGSPIDLKAALQRHQRDEQLLLAVRQQQQQLQQAKQIRESMSPISNRRQWAELTPISPSIQQPFVYPTQTSYINAIDRNKWPQIADSSTNDNTAALLAPSQSYQADLSGYGNSQFVGDTSSLVSDASVFPVSSRIFRTTRNRPIILQNSAPLSSNNRDTASQRIQQLDFQSNGLTGGSTSYFEPSTPNFYPSKSMLNSPSYQSSIMNMNNNLRPSLYTSAAAMQIPNYFEPTTSGSRQTPIFQDFQMQQTQDTKVNDSLDSNSSMYYSGNPRKRSYFNGLFKPSASSRYYYAPTILSPITLASPTTLHSLYAPLTNSAPTAPDPPTMTPVYTHTGSPTAYMLATPADSARQQYQVALAQAAAYSQPHYVTTSDTDMSESSLVPMSQGDSVGSSYAGDISSGSSQSSGGDSNDLPASTSSSGKSTGKSVVPWSNIAGLLLGVLPFGILMASLLPAVSVAGRKKRELVDSRARNFSDLLQWKPKSKVLSALGADDIRNELSSNQSRFRVHQSIPLSSFLGHILGFPESYPSKEPRWDKQNTILSEHRALDQVSPSPVSILNGFNVSTTISSPIPTTTPIPVSQSKSDERLGILSKLKKVSRTALNSLVLSTQNNAKLNHRSSPSNLYSDSVASLPVKSPQWRLLLKKFLINRLVANQASLVPLRSKESSSVPVGAIARAQSDRWAPKLEAPANSPTMLTTTGKKEELSNSILSDKKTNDSGSLRSSQLDRSIGLNSKLNSNSSMVTTAPTNQSESSKADISELYPAKFSTDIGNSSKQIVSVGPKTEPDDGVVTLVAEHQTGRDHLDVCLRQFLCRLASKLSESIKVSLSNGLKFKSNPMLVKSNSSILNIEPEQIEKVTKLHVSQLLDQIEAQIHNKSASFGYEIESDDSNSTSNLDTKGSQLSQLPNVSNNGRREKRKDILDSLYKNAIGGQCASSYECVELVQFQKQLARMKLKFNTN